MKMKRIINNDLGKMAVHDTTPLSRVLVPRTSFTVNCIGLLGPPYPDFHPLNFLNIFYPP